MDVETIPTDGEVPPRDQEIRTLVLPIECRAADGQRATLEGYAAVFNEPAQIGSKRWGWIEQIAPGAFTQTIAEDDIRALFNHDSNFVLGRNVAGTLSLAEDAKGLRVVIEPPDTAAGRDVLTSVKRGDVSGMSFSFRVRGETWTEPPNEDEPPQRTLLDVQLFDVGPVTFPAYPQTSVSARDQARSFAETTMQQEQAQAKQDAQRVLDLAAHAATK